MRVTITVLYLRFYNFIHAISQEFEIFARINAKRNNILNREFPQNILQFLQIGTANFQFNHAVFSKIHPNFKNIFFSRAKTNDLFSRSFADCHYSRES